MFFIASNFPLGEIGGIYKEWIYSAGKIDGKLIIYRKRITSIDEWEEFFDTDLMLSKTVNCECEDGIPVAFGVIDSLFVVIAKGKRKNIIRERDVHQFSVNLDTKEISVFYMKYEDTFNNFQDLCNICYQSNIFQYKSNCDWIIDSWKHKITPHIRFKDFTYRHWWCTEMSVNENRDDCWIMSANSRVSLTKSYKTITNWGIIDSRTFMYFTDKKQLVVNWYEKEIFATISADSDLKNDGWNDIGFWNFDGKLFALALKKISETEFEITNYLVKVTHRKNNIPYTFGDRIVKFSRSFSYIMHDICPDLHTSRFFVTSNVILFQDFRGIITVINESGFDKRNFKSSSTKPSTKMPRKKVATTMKDSDVSSTLPSASRKRNFNDSSSIDLLNLSSMPPPLPASRKRKATTKIKHFG